MRKIIKKIECSDCFYFLFASEFIFHLIIHPYSNTVINVILSLLRVYWFHLLQFSLIIELSKNTYVSNIIFINFIINVSSLVFCWFLKFLILVFLLRSMIRPNCNKWNQSTLKRLNITFITVLGLCLFVT